LKSSVFFFQAEDGIRDRNVTGVQTCALPISDPMEVAADVFTREDVCGHLHRIGTTLLHGLHRLQRQHAELITGVSGIAEMCFLRSEERRVGKEWRSERSR